MRGVTKKARLEVGMSVRTKTFERVEDTQHLPKKVTLGPSAASH